MERGVSMGTRNTAAQETVITGLPERVITERILEVAGQAGFQAALIDAVAGTVTAWTRLAWTIRAGAHGLRHRGLADGDTAGVFVQDAASFAIAVNAIRAAGATALPIRPDTPVGDLAAQLNASGARLLITSVPLAERAAEAADRSRVRQVFAFGEAPGTTSFRSLLNIGQHSADQHGADQHGADTPLAGVSGPAAGPDPTAAPGLSRRDVVVTGPPCGAGRAYTSRLDRTLLTGATIVAAPVPLIVAAIRVYQATAAIVPAGTDVPGIAPERVFAIA